MKEIMLSIQPKLVEKILNYEKTIEIRKTKPKCELPCKVYIYETKKENGKGKVVAEFTLNKVEQYGYYYSPLMFIDNHFKVVDNEITNIKFDYKNTCLTKEELRAYAMKYEVYAWHIDNLKIYDKSKELNNFYKELSYKEFMKPNCNTVLNSNGNFYSPLKNAPQSWCYVEEV